MKKLFYVKTVVNEDVNSGIVGNIQPQPNAQPQPNNNNQGSGSNQNNNQQQSLYSPEDATKIESLNSQLYQLSGQKDQLYTKMANIQKSIDEIKSRYGSNQAINPQGSQQTDVSANIMQEMITIIDVNDYLNEDNRPASIINFTQQPQQQQNTKQVETNVTPYATETEIPKEEVKPPKLDVDKTKLKHSEGGKQETADVIYVQFDDDDRAVIGKVFKRDESSDWETKVLKGESDTFEEMAFVSKLGVYGVLDKLEGFYDNVKMVKTPKGTVAESLNLKTSILSIN